MESSSLTIYFFLSSSIAASHYSKMPAAKIAVIYSST